MSVRAYRIIKIETEAGESFNLWRDNTLNDELEKSGYYDNLNDDSGGILEISISALKEIIEEIGNTINPDILENLHKDIEAAVDAGEEYIQYYCY